MTLKWNRKHRCYDLEREKVIRHVPFKYDSAKYRGNEVWEWVAIGLIVLFACGVLLFSCRNNEVYAAEVGYSNEQIADAIYIAEGGDKASHPYGILAHYKHTTPRQACINTIKSARRSWDGRSDFIAFLGSRYCPVGCSNDNGMNKYWIGNVKAILARSK